MGHLNILFISLTLLLILSAAFSAEEYQKVGLEDHNKYRKDHQVDALTLNENLNEMAVKCAEYYAKKGKIDHTCPHTGDNGENLYSASSTGGGGDPKTHTKTAIKLWYDEIEYYNWENPDCTKGKGGKAVGHFTQLVWKASKELGVGYFTVEDTVKKSFYVVALYSPRGNVQNQERENVLGVAPNQAPQWILVFLASTFITVPWKELYN